MKSMGNIKRQSLSSKSGKNIGKDTLERSIPIQHQAIIIWQDSIKHKESIKRQNHIYKSLNIREKILGNEHPSTATSYE